MDKYNEILIRDKYEKAGFSKKEIDVLGELDFSENSYRNELEKCFSEQKFDFESFFEKVKQIENDSEINEKIKRYAEYLYGVAIPFYDENIEKSDIDELKNLDPDLDNILLDLENPSIKSWVILEERNIKADSYHSRMDDIIVLKANVKIKKYITDSRYKWSVIAGIYHHFLIRNLRAKTLLKI
jgi:hypothetical protein